MAKVAVMGFGVVGSGVCEVLVNNQEHIAKKTGERLDLKYILDVRDLSDSPYADRVVHDFSIIENDPEVDIVVETIGGVQISKEFTQRALKAGKSVVTSNKALVAEHGFELLKVAEANGVSYLFEASVGGGVPILRPLHRCLAANEIQEIGGILNGTTNYILTRMIRGGLSFDEALKEAQGKGYAEADPSADVNGPDACRKLCILAAMAFGRRVMPEQVPTEGITGVTLADVAYAASCGKKVKFLGRAVRLPDDAVCAYVAPHLVDEENPLAVVEDVFNGITVKGDAVGDLMFYGHGAGRLATASAVVGDIIDVVKHRQRGERAAWSLGDDGDMVLRPDALESVWYVRLNAARPVVEQAFGDIQFLSRPDAPEGECAFLSGPMRRSGLEQKVKGLDVCSVFRVL